MSLPRYGTHSDGAERAQTFRVRDTGTVKPPDVRVSRTPECPGCGTKYLAHKDTHVPHDFAACETAHASRHDREKSTLL